MRNLIDLLNLNDFEFRYLFDLAVILLSTKVLGMLTRRVQLPQVVGALTAGLVLGPACMGILHETEIINSLAEVGVIVIMFSAGMETDVKALKNSGLKSAVIALFGVVVPLAGGYATAELFHPAADFMTRLQNVFIGVILTATSVSITVETLKELGKLSTSSGNAILGAALIDDFLGIIALTVITSLAGSDTALWEAALRIAGFLAFCVAAAFIMTRIGLPWLNRYRRDLRRFSIFAFAFCLAMAFCAEYFYGVSDITGAFVAGLILSNNSKTTYMLNRFDTVSYLLLSPVFFASVGLKVDVEYMSPAIAIFTAVLLITAVLTKIIGCGLGSRLCGYTKVQSLKIGVGMVSRGEVALIVAAKGAAAGLMVKEFFAPVVIVVVVTTIVTPIFLKTIYSRRKKNKIEISGINHTSPLLDKHRSEHT